MSIHPESQIGIFHEFGQSLLAERIWQSVSGGDRKISGVDKNNKKIIRGIIKKSIDRIVELEKIARMEPEERLANISHDTGMVLHLSGWGQVTPLRGLNKPAEIHSPFETVNWGKDLESERFKAAMEVMMAVTAKRSGKQISEVTTQELRECGPLFHYCATEWQNAHMKRALELFAAGKFALPFIKWICYEPLMNLSPGEGRILMNTFDQISGLVIPDSIQRLLIVAHSPHLLRAMHILNLYPQNIGKAVVQLWPVPSSEEALATKIEKIGDETSDKEFVTQIAQYIEWEIRGIIANFVAGKGAAEPYPYVLN